RRRASETQDRAKSGGRGVLLGALVPPETRHQPEVGDPAGVGIPEPQLGELVKYEITTDRGSVTVSSGNASLAKEATLTLADQAAERRDREAIAKQLDQQAADFERRADAQTVPTCEIRKYLLEKARTARTHAAQIRAGEGMWRKS